MFNVSTTGNNYINNVFVVPASFRGGTLTISGTAFLDDGETYTVNSPVTIPIQMPN